MMGKTALNSDKQRRSRFRNSELKSDIRQIIEFAPRFTLLYTKSSAWRCLRKR